MGKIIDLTGRRFNRLLVIEQSDSYFSPKGVEVKKWKCLCDCGNETFVSSSSLRSGKTKSCGCFNNEMKNKFEDLTGKIFGELEIISYDHKEKNSNGKGYTHFWKCKCSCGNEKIINHRDLKRNHVKSCGCMKNKESYNRKNKVGQKFGRLLVLNFEYKKNNRIYYKCLCDCGNYSIISSSGLRKTKSCGCLWKESISLPEGKSSFNSIYNRYRNSKNAKKFGFNLNEDVFIELITSKCFYCGEIPNQIQKSNNGNFTYNGIDRIDSSKGYVVDNVVTCCGRCNEAKLSMSQTVFINKIKTIYERFFSHG